MSKNKNYENNSLVQRTFNNTCVLRALDSNDIESNIKIVEGYALKFNQETELYRGWYWEQIAPEAMDTADLSNVVFNLNHNDDYTVARTTNNTLELIVDEIGLKIRATLDINDDDSKKIYQKIQSGNITQMSFRAYIDETNRTERPDDDSIHSTVTKFGKFYDVSAVTFPAYDDTNIETVARALNMDISQIEEIYEKRAQKSDEKEQKTEKITNSEELRAKNIEKRENLLKKLNAIENKSVII